MDGVVKGLDKAMQSMDLEKVNYSLKQTGPWLVLQQFPMQTLFQFGLFGNLPPLRLCDKPTGHLHTDSRSRGGARGSRIPRILGKK